MKKIAIGIVAILVIVMLVLATIVVMAGDGIWPTPWDPDPDPDPDPNEVSGSWGQEVLVEYADGTNESLKIASDSVLSIWSSDKEIRGIHYVLNAKAEGSGYSSILYDIAEFTFMYEATDGINTNTKMVPCDGYTLSSRPVDGEWHQLIHHYTSADDIIPDTFPSGDYTVTISSSGALKYSADGESQVTVTNLPDTISFTLSVEEDSSISVSFSSGYEVFE